MMGLSSRRASRPGALATLLLASTALLTTAIAQEAAPAVAEGSEEVTVTAQRRGPGATVQKTPIAITAMGQKELESKSIESFKDLQFSVPSVTYSNGNFGGNNFQIRGIGLSAVGTTADSGVSVHTNDVYNYGTAGLATGEYYDLERIEVLRGPQSTLYGRNATGGVVNIITAKPDSSEMYFHADGTYGEYNTVKGNFMANLPIVENELALRLAYNYSRHDGYVENVFLGTDVNSQNLQQARASLRWEPSESTTIDFIGSYTFEKDSRMRYPKQLCKRDPSGVLGCLPDGLGFQATNGNSGFGTTLASAQGPLGALGLSLFDLTQGPGTGANALVPNDNLQIATDIDPTYQGDGVFYMASLRQEITPWLTMTALANYSDGSSKSTSHYNNTVGEDIGPRIDAVVAQMRVLSQVFTGSQAAADLYIDTFFTAPDGTIALPLSEAASGGITAGPNVGTTVRNYSRNIQGYDLITGSTDQASGELRFNTSFDGPVNFMVAGFYFESEGNADYYVNSNLLDYNAIMFGYAGYLLGAGGQGPALINAPSQFISETRLSQLKSKAVFGEAYWDVNDELKVTAGLRWTEDRKKTLSKASLFLGNVPVGTTNLDPILGPPTELSGTFDAVTGRLVVEWTPDLSFTDDTLVYGSYSRGFKSGGLNPPLSSESSPIPVPLTFDPEEINAYEIGIKNRFMDNKIQANLTAYYYDYKGYQISEIIARTSVNKNVDATIWGLEGEFLYKPTSNWQFNLTVTNTDSEIGDVSIVDQRNPGAGVANSVVIKDIGSGANCVILMLPGAGGLTPADAGVPGYYVPPGGSAQLAANGVPNVNFGVCPGTFVNGQPVFPAGLDPAKYGFAADPSGIPVSIEGNELPQTPKNTVSLGAQYTLPIDGGYEMVIRGDYYWQGDMWTRVMNSDPVDKIESWDIVNLSIQLNALEQGWYARVFATNVFDEHNLTGTYLTDASSGLFSNAFVQDPRVIGVTVGLDF